MSHSLSKLWYAEYEPTNCTSYHPVKSVLFDGRTAYHDVTVLDTEEWGKTLLVDGELQSTETDELLFHEALVHPAMIAHPDPRKVLILGSGEGAVLREVLSYRSIAKVVMADIDEDYVDICAEHMPEWSEGCFEDENLDLEFDDVNAFLSSTSLKFDVIFADAIDYGEDDNAEEKLHTSAYYRKLKERLAPGGILVAHGLTFDHHDPQDHSETLATLNAVFPIVSTYVSQIPSSRDDFAFVTASDNVDPSKLTREEIDRRLSERGINDDRDLSNTLYFYDADAHTRMYSLPKNIKTALNGRFSGRAAEE